MPGSPTGENTAGQRPAPKLMFCAGENSGDLHAAKLIQELRKLLPGLQCFGYGGERMEAAGMRLDENLAQKLPVIGLTQAVRAYRKLRALLTQAEQLLAEEKPDALVLVDYPGFNLRLAQSARQLGVRVFYYISPQLWAWRRERIKTIARCVDRMLVILPFEEQIYRDANVPVTYVGHPLQDEAGVIRPRHETRLGIGVLDEAKLIGLVPGSREAEVIRHLPVMLAAAKKIREVLPNARFVLPRASTISNQLLEKYLAREPDVQVVVADRDLKSLRAALDFAICKSGTSTLELALLGVPMVIVYKVSVPTYLLAKAVLRIPWVGLVNIVANDMIVPELLQGDAEPERIAKASLRLLMDDRALDTMRGDLKRVADQIGRAGASKHAAQVLAEELARGVA